jgi:nicotinate-nucleotide pyrophosphorylase (carboxylating)
MLTKEPFSAGLRTLIETALAEDIGTGDATTNAIIPAPAKLRAKVIAKEPGVIAGLSIAEMTFQFLDDRVRLSSTIVDGEQVQAGQTLAEIEGSGRAILTAERTALNFLGRMSGIATLTRQFVDEVSGTKAKILDTRKTAPNIRLFDKMAVRLGGGENHRMGLFDMILIKDNHIDFAGSITEAVTRARRANSELEIEVEARTLADVSECLTLGVSWIMLDNMSLEELREAVRLVSGRAKLEASGNVTVQSVRSIAETGLDYISVGALTHSVRALDVSLVVNWR